MRARATRAVAFTLSFLVAAAAAADEVDRYVEAQLRKLHIPGASLAVVRDGKVIKAQGYGLANLELKTPATKSTVYEVGSVTKQFTAAAIMLLVEEGKIALEDSVTKYFPEAPETWKPITIRHLLTHTSGIQNHVAIPGYLKAFKTNLAREETPTRDELLKMFFALPLEFQPGETWAYDNTGYILLGFIVEQASGRTFWEFLRERLFEPAGMSATRSTDPQPIVPNRASGYAWANEQFENRPVLLPFIAFSAGSIISSVEDMVKWDAALAGEKVLKRESLEQMSTPAKTRDGAEPPFTYGFGWFLDSYRGRRIIQHSGGTPGFSSSYYRFVDDKLTIILLTNHSDRVLDQMAVEIAGMYVPKLKRPDTKTDPDPQMSVRLRDAASGLLKGEPQLDAFTAPMQKFLKTASGKAWWQWFAEHGELTSFTFSEREELGDRQVLRYRLGLGENLYWFAATVAADGKIVHAYLW